MNVAELIAQKRDGEELTPEDLAALISGFTDGEVPDYQMAAFGMAVLFRGMTLAETIALTAAMRDSGDQLQWPDPEKCVDKHSTGGVGDKISLILAPLLAACDLRVPMISGRGLGPTGGTLDKLDAIPGFRSEMSADEFRSVVNWSGCGIVGATANLAPADQRWYALRDVTGTVPSVPLITASILSKKLAAGISSLVLDVKWGSGAFMRTLEEARELAESLIQTGSGLGLNVAALVTDMNQPLGRMIGNSVEVEEAIAVLKNEGPDDVRELTLQQGQVALKLAGIESDSARAIERLEDRLATGAAWERFEEMVRGQGGELSRLPKPEFPHVVEAEKAGFVNRIETRRLGLAVIEMGGGRRRIEDRLNYRVGIKMQARLGDRVEAGQPLATVFCDRPVWQYAAELVAAAFALGDQPVSPPPLVAEQLTT